jgi:hypothetical protein
MFGEPWKENNSDCKTWVICEISKFKKQHGSSITYCVAIDPQRQVFSYILGWPPMGMSGNRDAVVTDY